MNFKKIAFLMLLAAIVLTAPGPGELGVLAGKVKPSLIIVVDAGHGGPDGGAEGVDGTQEAELNLAIAKALQEEGEKRGIKVIMTRETQEGLYAAENLEKKWRKLEDMKCRKAIIDESKADTAVSIHMNCFQADASVRGAQVFYPKSGNAEILKKSEALADAVQQHLITGLKDGTNRLHMGKGSVYLLENPTVPTILVECGFLSNPQDLSSLKDKKWQKKVAGCILDGIQSNEEI